MKMSFWNKTGVALFSILLMLGANSSLAAGARYALVVGNSNYINAPVLSNPENDARLMTDVLKQSGFKVTVLVDADYQTLKKALIAFGRLLRQGNVEAGLFYYAGHGVQVRGENYLVPVASNITSEDEVDLEAININDFLQVMNSSKSQVNIVILDACRDNPFKSSSRNMGRGLAPVDAPKGTYIAYATAPGEVALDGENGNSPYTTALSEAIRQPGVPIERVFKTARVKVLESTGEKQVPWEVSSITGEFYFQPGSTSQGKQAAPTKTTAGDPVAKAFELAQNEGSISGWQAFISEFGDRSQFYNMLANERLAALPPTEPEPSIIRSPPQYQNEVCDRPGAVSGIDEICTSSVLDPQFGNRYGPINLFDRNPATAWVEGARNQGEGEAFVITLKSETVPSILRIMNGYNKSDDIFTKNSRIRDLVISTSAGEERQYTLEDTMGWQEVPLHLEEQAQWLEFRIGSVYPGSKYRDTALSEIQVD